MRHPTYSRKIPLRVWQTSNETPRNRIRAGFEHNWNRLGGFHGCNDWVIAAIGDNCVNSNVYKLGAEKRVPFGFTFPEAPLNDDVLSFNVTKVAQPLPEG